MPEHLTSLPAGIVGAVPVTYVLFFTATLSPALVAANTTAEQTFTVTGVIANPNGGGVLLVSKPTAQAGLGIVGARISAANTIAITFSNNTAGGLTPTASEVYSFVLFQ